MNYINIASGEYPVTESTIRAGNPNVSYPAPFPVPDGYSLVFPAPQPAYNPTTQSVRETLPELTALGHYEQRWGVQGLPVEVVAQNITAAKAAKWEAIKARRDTRKAAGAQVGAFWFHTDADSRIQQLGLKDQARDVLAAGGTTATVMQKLGQNIQWQTFGGESTPMTVALSFSVVSAVGDLDAVCHFVAGQHRAAMQASADPVAYDFSTGWPVAFGD